MFASITTTLLASRSRAALATVRSLLTLESDPTVDWEVDQEDTAVRTHPHRERLRAPWLVSYPRRAGQPPAAEQVCICPLRRADEHRPSPPPARRLMPLPSADARRSHACGQSTH